MPCFKIIGLIFTYTLQQSLSLSLCLRHSRLPDNFT